MSLQSYLKPDRGEPFNNIYYYYCMHMRCVSSSGGKCHVVALVPPSMLSLGIELRDPGLHGKCLYQRIHLNGPDVKYFMG